MPALQREHTYTRKSLGLSVYGYMYLCILNFMRCFFCSARAVHVCGGGDGGCVGGSCVVRSWRHVHDGGSAVCCGGLRSASTSHAPQQQQQQSQQRGRCHVYVIQTLRIVASADATLPCIVTGTLGASIIVWRLCVYECMCGCVCVCVKLCEHLRDLIKGESGFHH